MESFKDFLLLPFLLPFPYLKQKQKLSGLMSILVHFRNFLRNSHLTEACPLAVSVICFGSAALHISEGAAIEDFCLSKI